MNSDSIISNLEPIKRMSRDVRQASTTLSDQEARYLVDAYYQMQEDRIRAMGRVRAMEETGEPHAVIVWLGSQSNILEDQIKGALDKYSMAHPVGRWLRSIKGVGPVIAAGFLANLDIHRAPTAGSFWAVCGLIPGQKRKKGEKMTWNPALKRLAWIVGESFKKLKPTDEDAYYRHVYDARKKYETEKSEAGEYAEQAKAALEGKKYRDDAKAKTFYEAGKLPPGHLDRRAARYAAKLLLAHLHEVWWRHEFGEDPAKPYPVPYAIAHLGHAHKIDPPA